jgi:hypothetical protein
LKQASFVPHSNLPQAFIGRSQLCLTDFALFHGRCPARVDYGKPRQ